MAPVAAFGRPALPQTNPTARFPLVSQPPTANPPHRCQAAQGPQKALTPPVSTPLMRPQATG